MFQWTADVEVILIMGESEETLNYRSVTNDRGLTESEDHQETNTRFLGWQELLMEKMKWFQEEKSTHDESLGHYENVINILQRRRASGVWILGLLRGLRCCSSQ